MKYRSFTDMPVWKNSIKLSGKVFILTVSLPRSEDYGLTSQLRRAANSVSANIAEAFGRNTNKDKASFYIHSRGSAFEVQSHLRYGEEVGYFDTVNISDIFEKYSILVHDLNKIIKTLNSKP